MVTPAVPQSAEPTSEFASHRVVIAMMCFVALVIAYCDRVNVAVAAPQIMLERHWDTLQMSWVFSGFFLGYALFLIPSGMLVQTVGARRVLCWSIGGWSLLTWLTPHPHTLTGMYLVRLGLGIFESALFPCINSLLAAWFPPQEYAMAAGFCWSGGYAGPILAFPVATMILSALGWQSIFYAFGGAGLGWALICWKLLAASPIQRTQHQAMSSGGILTGLKLLRKDEVWAVFALHFSSNWYIYLLLTWLPTYMVRVRGFSGSLAAAGSALPFATALMAANFFAVAIAKLTLRRNRTAVRKRMLIVYLGGAVIFALLPRIGDPAAFTATLAISTGLITAATPVYAAGSLELAPKSAGMLAGMQQAFANLAGVIAPVVTGYLARGSWSYVFIAAAVVCAAGALAYAIFGSAESILTVNET
jgi:MFS family permease